MQGRVGNHHATDGNGFQARHRGQLAGPANLNIDSFDQGLGLLGGKLVGNRPARRARGRAQTILPVQAVDLVDDSIDVIGPGAAPRLGDAVVGHHLRRIHTDLMFLDLKAPGLHGRQDTGLGMAGQGTDLAPGIGPETQLPRCRNGGIELAQGAGSGIARVGVRGPFGGILLSV